MKEVILIQKILFLIPEAQKTKIKGRYKSSRVVGLEYINQLIEKRDEKTKISN